METCSAAEARLPISHLDALGKQLRNDGKVLQFSQWDGSLHVSLLRTASLQVI